MLRPLTPAALAAVLIAALPLAGCGSGARFDEDRLLAHISTLSSDEFKGDSAARGHRRR